MTPTWKRGTRPGPASADGLDATAQKPLLVYAPGSSLRVVLVVWWLVLVVIMGAAYLESGVWFPWPPESELQVLLWLLILVLPLLWIQDGWCYEIYAAHLAVSRYGRRQRLLSWINFKHSTATLGLVRLVFRDASVWLWGAQENQARQHFLHVAHVQAEKAGVLIPPSVYELSGRLRVRLSQVDFGSACVTCRRPAECWVGLDVRRGIELPLIGGVVQEAELRIPACALHAAKRKSLTYWNRWAFFGLWALLWLVAMTWEGAVWHGALVVSGCLAAVVYQTWTNTVAARCFDSWALGIYATRLSADLTTVTLSIRNDQTRAVVKQAAT